LEFGSEQSYHVSEEGNRIGLGFNLCVAPPRHYAEYDLQFQDSCQRLELERGQTRGRQRSDKGQTEVEV